MPDDSESKPIGKGGRFRRIVGIGITSLILAAAVVSLTLYFRGEMRQRLVERDATMLHSVMLAQYERGLSKPGENGGEHDLASLTGAQMQALLEASKLRDVIAGRLFSPTGEQLYSVPAMSVAEARISNNELKVLKDLRPIAGYYPDETLGEVFRRVRQVNVEATKKSTVPMLKVSLPLHRQDEEKLLGVAELIFHSESLNEDFALLDRSLLIHGGAVLLLGLAALIVVTRQPLKRWRGAIC